MFFVQTDRDMKTLSYITIRTRMLYTWLGWPSAHHQMIPSDSETSTLPSIPKEIA